MKIFTVPFPVDLNKDNSTIFTTSFGNQSSEEIIMKAINYHSEGNISEAVKYYQYCIYKKIYDSRIFSNYGIILKDLGKLNDAKILTEKAIEMTPEYAEAHNNMGNIMRDLGNIPKAEFSYQKAISIKPDFAIAHYNLGNIMKEVGELDKAEISTKKAIQIKPDLAIAHYNLGNIMKEHGELDQAERSIRKAIQINPDFAQAYSNLGTILSDLGHLREAELVTRKAIQINPDFAQAYSNLGTILCDLGHLREAELVTRKAIQINPDFAQAHNTLGNIFRELGKDKEHKECLEKAIILDPKSEKVCFDLVQYYYLKNEYELAIKYIGDKESKLFQTIYLGCLLGLNRKEDFYKKYAFIKSKNISNPEIGSIVDHANVIYDKKVNSTFCNKSIEYILIEKINKECFSDTHMNQIISFLKSNELKSKDQPLLTNGSQTSGELFALNYPFIKSIKKAIESKILIYKERFKNSKEGLIKKWPSSYKLRAWAVVMNKGGFLKPHNHTYGWISGSFYLNVPLLRKNINEGNIAFSYRDPKLQSTNKEFEEVIQKVETRDIVIFPSSLFHHTIPFDNREERICFVFDLIPTT